MADTAQTARRNKIAAAILICYWIALFLGTHVPHPPQSLLAGARDKTLHFSAYAGLAFLLSLNWSLRRELGWRQWIGIVVSLALFGAFDEVTQIPVGRECDLADWTADLVGILAGSLTFLAVAAAWRRNALADQKFGVGGR